MDGRKKGKEIIKRKEEGKQERRKGRNEETTKRRKEERLKGRKGEREGGHVTTWFGRISSPRVISRASSGWRDYKRR